MVFRFQDFELDEAAFALRRGGQTLAIQPLALAALLYFVRHAGTTR